MNNLVYYIAVGLLTFLVGVHVHSETKRITVRTGFRHSCGNELLREVASPDGKMKAVVFQRDCAATTGFITQVSVLSKDEKLPNESGNVFSADTNHGVAPSGEGGGPVVEVGWFSLAVEMAA